MTPISRLDDFLPYCLSTTSNAVSARIAQEYRKRFSLSVPEWRIMAVLGDAGGVTQRELTERTLMDKVAVNRACKLLSERELIARKPNAKDGRSHLLHLSETGEEMYAKIMPVARNIERQLFAGFSTEDVDRFRHMLRTVRAEVGDLDSDSLTDGSYR
ncbi:MarR family winged helix-turn-helix transcriptional regulator [Paraurantiacibacter namhicola]|uniref:Transcriptional regulator HosA n=1 Tax=Paraurantiacibacter namhicola TaxID=645517 RepID=A0A1C7DAX9_9SPHN|nr:MarR family winged helix-turn-helix transcriptional regulator [Paraurantiacibacter namhicola]ANU08604.1 Transcriptional regulator HosA [Paraurantiacibacter namhicola]